MNGQRLLVSLLLACQATILTAGTNTPAVAVSLRTVAELQQLPQHTAFRTLGFELTGKVLSRKPESLSFEDATGRTGLRLHRSLTVNAGDLVTVRGVVRVRHASVSSKTVTELSVIGHADPPRPRGISLAEAKSGVWDHYPVTVRGRVIDAVQDDVDGRYYSLLLLSGEDTFRVSVADPRPSPAYEKLKFEEVAVTGTCTPSLGGARRFNGRALSAQPEDIRKIGASPFDPFDAPTVYDLIRASDPQDAIGHAVLRTAVGTVTAVWQGDNFLLFDNFRQTIRVRLSDRLPPPRVGETVKVVGMPETDLFSLVFSCASWKPHQGELPKPSAPKECAIGTLCKYMDGKYHFDPTLHGKSFTLNGTVRNVSKSEFGDHRLHLRCGDFIVPVDASSCPEALRDVENDCRIKATGVCLMETELLKSDYRFPRVNGFALVLRHTGDIRILSRPSWWTTGRLLAVIGSLVAALLGFVVWNRILNRLVELRGRELLRERIAHAESEFKIAERTRLAVELHDSLSQNLAAVAYQISASRKGIAAKGAADGQLLTAERMLKSCRTDLRHCLSDLRGNTLEERNFTAAIRKTLNQLEGDAEITLSVDIPRARLPDPTAHALLCIIRELTSNALFHGHARHIRITGEAASATLTVVVTDDGCGFDGARCPGPAEGHFGLDGIRERLRKLDGSLTIESGAGAGTVATVTFPLSGKGKAKQT